MNFNKLVRDAFGLDVDGYTGDLYGVEVEMEGKPLVTAKATEAGWLATRDTSLRGDGAKEWVMRRPMTAENAVTAIHTLYEAVGEENIDDSMRAGVHVHLNMRDTTLKELFTFLALYYSLELIITDRFGEDRVGNLFCLRSVDADYINSAISTAILTGQLGDYLGTENIRYGAINLHSLSKYGTVEFRAMKTPTTPEPIVDWVLSIDRLWKFSKTFRDPIEVLQSFSAAEDNQVLFGALGQHHAEIALKSDDFQMKLMEGIRSIQFWVFTSNWEN